MDEEMRRNWFVVATAVAYLGANIAISLTRGGWRWQSIATVAILAACLLFGWWFDDGAMYRYLIFGLIAGFFELPIDAWMARRTGTLIYPTREPMIWASPAYMPFGWALVLVQICTLGDWASDRFHVVWASVLVTICSGLYIPLYEHLAKDGKLWWYVNTRMIFNAPYYIILAELMLAIPLVWMGLQAERLESFWWIALLGVIEGLVVMSVSVWIAFALVGRPPASGTTPNDSATVVSLEGVER